MPSTYAVITHCTRLSPGPSISRLMAGSAGNMASMAMAWMAISSAVNVTNSPNPIEALLEVIKPGGRCPDITGSVQYFAARNCRAYDQGAPDAFETAIPAARSVERPGVRRLESLCGR